MCPWGEEQRVIWNKLWRLDEETHWYAPTRIIVVFIFSYASSSTLHPSERFGESKFQTSIASRLASLFVCLLCFYPDSIVALIHCERALMPSYIFKGNAALIPHILSYGIVALIIFQGHCCPHITSKGIAALIHGNVFIEPLPHCLLVCLLWHWGVRLNEEGKSCWWTYNSAWWHIELLSWS